MKISFTILALSLLCCWVPGDATEHVLCPPINEVVTEGSPCQSECYGDEYCQADSGNNNTLCCPSSTCGQQCVTPLNVPYHTPALACPKVGDDVVGACWENCASCSDDELCCSNGCGHECKTAVQVTPICQGITDSHNGTSRPGEYIPQCSEDGTFSPVQCHGSSGYCWCVRPDTGEPVGKSMTRFQRPECNNCSHNGQVYYPADSFSDDCNTCLCFEDGSVSCTEIGCNAGCTHNGQVYYPGDSFSDDCNTCLCSEDGSVSCTEMDCNAGCTRNGQVYYPGDSFSDDCNTCLCSENGSVSCTEMDCNHGLVSPYHSCPVLEDDMAGICSEECSSDDDCNNDQKCCSNGCGHTCMDPIPIPFIAPPRKCPDTEDNECDVPECTDSCENSKLCCENGCNSLVCVDGILPLYPCTTTVNNLTGGELLGRFVPQCNEENGNFRALQCSSHYCWCVDTASGEPTSDMRESGSVGELECSSCEYKGKMYDHGTVVEVYEECSKSTCLAGELVRSQGCDQCEYNGKMYEHGEHTDRCGYCTCLDGGIACADSVTLCSDHCIHKGLYHIPGDVFPEGDGCNTCFCSNDFEVTCTEVDCDGEGEDSDELAWWHSVMIGAGSLIAVLAVITIGLLVVMVMMIRSSQFRHKRLQETSETLSFEHDTEVLFKNGPPEAECVELKVPVEDDADPVNT